MQYIQGDRIEQVFHDDSKDRALGCCSNVSRLCRNGHASHPTSVQCIDCLESCLGTLS